MFDTPLIPFILIAALIIAVAIFGMLAERKRRNELAAWARANKMSFSPAKNRSADERLRMFGCFQKGSSRYSFNEITGEWKGRRFWGFDYHYLTRSRDSKGRTQTHHHNFSAVLLSSPFPLKPLTIRPEHVLDKFVEFFGFDDIDFESAEFSRKFHVKAEDRKWAFDILHTRAMEFLMGAPRFIIELEDGWALAYDVQKFSVARFTQAAQVLEGLLDRIPDYVRQQQSELSGGRK